ncbi:type VI secretion system tube protein Hcp [Dyadobacter sp. CY326]|uniref:type VI secretion system tube protein Hcp n=1 Tax=Dyadobacter sp. CY326 TaxID=2907300 RepID=UPI001F25CD5F|nr:type VI secretion system tube protein Hcp [Dyadobacter sp. CY326]MCE7067077.1 type VI secretion system tube protein Hcp [Dyadobacter sp. CY326]
MKTNHVYLLLFFLSLISVTSQAQEIYFYSSSITQGKGTGAHVDEVKLTSEAGGMYNDAGGKTHFLPFTITKNFDASSTEIMQFVASGKVVMEAEIRFYNGSSLVLSYLLRAVKINSYEQASAEGCPSCPTVVETIQINYQGLKVGSFSWNAATNSSTL